MRIDDHFASLIPPLSVDERAQLEANLLEDGCRDPLVVWAEAETLLDGHNRYEICTRLGLPFAVTRLSFATADDAKIWVIENQFGRRNLEPFVRGTLALALKPLLAARAKERQREHGGTAPGRTLVPNLAQVIEPKVRDQVAALAGVSHGTLDAVGKVLATGSDELKAATRAGDVSISAAADLATLPKDEQTEIVAKGEKAILDAARDIRARRADDRRDERMGKLADISAGNRQLDFAVRFPVILADPPWRYEHAVSESRAIENQYPTMTLDEICALPVAEVAHDDAVLFLWATSPKLAEALHVIEAWGFTYRTCAVWDKGKIGMGYYFRQQHELLLVATRGTPPAPAPADRPPSVLSFLRGEHSAKPVEVCRMIEAMYPGVTCMEMFCRNPQPGWSTWGNQA